MGTPANRLRYALETEGVSMIFSTPTQFAVLALMLLAGFLFGLASAAGGKRHRERLRTLEAEHAAYRKDSEARIRAAEADRDRVVKASPVAAQMVERRH
jgi:hypothetical protein